MAVLLLHEVIVPCRRDAFIIRERVRDVIMCHHEDETEAVGGSGRAHDRADLVIQSGARVIQSQSSSTLSPQSLLREIAPESPSFHLLTVHFHP